MEIEIQSSSTRHKKPQGGWAESESRIEHLASEYFQCLFTLSQPEDFDEALQYVTKKVTPTMNVSVTCPPSDKEIKQAVRDINPEKAPGPDGMTSFFIKASGRPHRRTL